MHGTTRYIHCQPTGPTIGTLSQSQMKRHACTSLLRSGTSICVSTSAEMRPNCSRRRQTRYDLFPKDHNRRTASIKCKQCDRSASSAGIPLLDHDIKLVRDGGDRDLA